jgi:N utilization substance protein B|tara:strand:+ start:168 stop:1100 length:933 start_codon:yes stop_codon:yes gene_type:complete
MLNRRHIRTKVMQSIFEMQHTKSQDLNIAYKKLNDSASNMYDLYLLQYQIFTVILQKARKLNNTSQSSFLKENKVENIHRLVNNVCLNHIASSQELALLIEERNLTNWELDDEYASLFLKQILASDFYNDYLKVDSSFEKDKELVLVIFKKIIAPNEKLYSYYEDTCISWVDDLPLVNTMILKELKKAKVSQQMKLTKLYKDEDDKVFGKQLLNKVVLNNDELSEYINIKTPKWDADRIASMDAILMKMAICEFLKFPSIPVKVTINEYLEIAKEYSTNKSSTFINGILDSLIKDFKKEEKLQKIGRGLM